MKSWSSHLLLTQHWCVNQCLPFKAIAILLSKCHFLRSSLGSRLNLSFWKPEFCVRMSVFAVGTLEWCNPRNGGKPVHKGCHQMTQWPQPCANCVPATSFRAHTCTWLMCCFLFFFFCCRGSISMASSDDAEGTLTPVDFIQLQHYMECKSRRVACNYPNCNFVPMKGQSCVNVNHVVFHAVIKTGVMRFDRPVYRERKAAQLKIFSWTLRGCEPNEMVAGF